MRITDLLSKDRILLNASPASKKEAIGQAIDLMMLAGIITDKEAYRASVYKREKEGTTGIGEGIAIPHGKCGAVKAPGLAAMVIPQGVHYDALDGEPVTLLFLIAAPNTKDNVHLEVLSRLSRMLMDEEFTRSLREAASVEAFLRIIDEREAQTFQIEQEKVRREIPRKKLLAVTSCPTGIAHTYMAAEALEQAAKVAGCDIQVETRGSGGVKNGLTGEEIAEADCIIVAADAKVPMERFEGKSVILSSVSDGIGKAQDLVERALSGNVPIYRGTVQVEQEREKVSEGTGHRVYTWLMNGVSHMLPFVVGGGILIAIAFLLDGLLVDMNSLSLEERGNFGSITPIAKFCKDIGGIAFGLMLPVLAGYIAMAIGDRPALALGFVGGMMAANGTSGFLGAIVAGFVAGFCILLLRKLCKSLPEALEKIAPVLIYPLFGIFLIGIAMRFVVEPVMGALNTGLNAGLASMGQMSRVVLGLVLGGMMAIDMGGPFNKAAYVFGTAAIASGNYDIMAAVMIGGMTPPCGIAFATVLFPNKFTKQERESSLTSFIMGLSFITEGAIPYAAADPLRVIPACIAGSAVAGALSMVFGCTLMAPHGGIFVVPVMNGPLWYLVALLVGIVVSAFLLGILKKRVA